MGWLEVESGRALRDLRFRLAPEAFGVSVGLGGLGLSSKEHPRPS